MRLHGHASRLTVVVGETLQHHHRPVYTEIVHRAHKLGVAGATVLRGHEGFGSSQRLHVGKLTSLAEDVPVVVIIVDTRPKIDELVAALADLPDRGITTIDEIEVYRYLRDRPHAAPTDSTAPSTDGSAGRWWRHH
jgi:PII-like signaling protein